MWWRLLRAGGAGSVTRWLECCPTPEHSTISIIMASRQFLGQCSAKRAYVDGSQELKGARKARGIMADVATPHRPQTNCVADRAARRGLEGARAVLLASGLPQRWWAEAARRCCFSRNVRDPADKDFAPHQLRHQAELEGKLVPIGAMVQDKPAAKREVGTVKNFDSRVIA